jgi:hypothetical protein
MSKRTTRESKSDGQPGQRLATELPGRLTVTGQPYTDHMRHCLADKHHGGWR